MKSNNALIVILGTVTLASLGLSALVASRQVSRSTSVRSRIRSTSELTPLSMRSTRLSLAICASCRARSSSVRSTRFNGAPSSRATSGRTSEKPY